MPEKAPMIGDNRCSYGRRVKQHTRHPDVTWIGEKRTARLPQLRDELGLRLEPAVPYLDIDAGHSHLVHGLLEGRRVPRLDRARKNDSNPRIEHSRPGDSVDSFARGERADDDGTFTYARLGKSVCL